MKNNLVSIHLNLM